MRRKDTSPRFDANAAAISLWTQGVQIGPILDVVVLKKASHLFVIEVRVPSRSPEHRSSCVRVCQDSQHYAHRKVVDDVGGANLFSQWQPSSLWQPSSSLAVFFSLKQKLLTMERGVRDARFVNDGSTKVVSEFNQGNVDTKRCIFSAKY